MRELFNEKVRVFAGGAIAGALASVRLLFTNGDIYVGFFLKLMGAIFIAFFSGFVTLIAHDTYKYVKPRFFVFIKKAKNYKFKIFKNGNKKENGDEENKVA